MRLAISAAAFAVLAAGCADDNITSPDSTVLVEGHFERVSPDDMDSTWVGIERTTVLDRRGDVACATDLEVEAELAATGGCAKCAVTLELLRELADRDDCASAARGLGDEPLFLTFEASAAAGNSPFGTILVSDDQQTWEPYTAGKYQDGVLTWSYEGSPRLVSGLDDVRELREEDDRVR